MKRKVKEVTEKAVTLRTKPLLIPQEKRKPNPLNKWIKETKNSYQVTRKDICYVYRNIIFAKTFGELKEMMGDITKDHEKRDKYPVFVVAIIAGVLADIARGNMANITKMLQFIFPDVMKGFDTENLVNRLQDGYDEIINLEMALRKLEGDDAINIVDKMMMAQDASYEVKNA